MEEGRLSGRKRRRGSLSRALQRIRLAMRKNPDAAASTLIPEESPQAPGLSAPSSTATGHVSAGIPAATTHHREPATINGVTADATASDLLLIVDTSSPIEVGDPNDPIPSFAVPMDGWRSARARVVFEKYGIQYEEGTQFRPDGRSYVDRLIRIRLHWECHQCKTGFGGSTTCKTCGHDRCADCSRSPAEKVREFLGDTKAMREIEAQAAQASPDRDSVLVPIAVGANVATLALDEKSTDGSVGAVRPMDIAVGEDHPEDPDVDLMQMRYTNRRIIGMGPQLHPRPNGDRVRCTCHECGAYFTPSHTHKCQHCGHGRCSACKFVPEPTDIPVQLALADADPPLRRVYRKARQRVRWSCERCDATFLSSRICANCGHERCSSCIRSPIKKPALTEALPPMQTITAVV